MTANPVVISHMQDLNVGFWRQLLCEGTSAPWDAAVDALAPGILFMGAAGKPSDDESTIRGQVDALAASPHSAYCVAILGDNEPNDSDAPWGTSNVQNTIKRQYWRYDETQTLSWPHRAGGTPPPVWSPALKRNGSNPWDPDGHRYDDDVALMASTTYNPGSGALHLADVCDGIDHHQYDGGNSPGSRVNGQDSYGDVPASLTVSAVDGKCSRVDFEIALAQQQAPGKPVKARTEFGWEEPTGTDQHGLWAAETMLRCWKRGVYACWYEMIDEGPSNPNGSGNWFGTYNLAGDVEKPVYQHLKALWGHGGTAAFTGTGWFEPISGNNPDHEVVVLPNSDGSWDLHILWEARTTTDLVLAPGHHVVGLTRTSRDTFGNKRYRLTQDDTMTVLTVV